MRKFRIISIGLCIILFFNSCIKEDYDASECVPKIIIEFDWSMVGEPADDERVEVLITEMGEEQTYLAFETTPDGTEIRIEPDFYEFVGDEVHPNVELDRCAATVRKDANGNFLEPGYFVAGSVEQAIDPNLMVQVVTIPMRHQTRPLIIRVVLNGDSPEYFSGADAEISGIAMSRHINDAFPPIDGQALHPALITGTVDYTMQYENSRSYSDRKTLLGIDGSSQQIVTFQVYYSDGTQETISRDVTDRMYGFHIENVTEPWVLQFVLNISSTANGVEDSRVTIEEWHGSYESDIVAH